MEPAKKKDFNLTGVALWLKTTQSWLKKSSKLAKNSFGNVAKFCQIARLPDWEIGSKNKHEKLLIAVFEIEIAIGVGA